MKCTTVFFLLMAFIACEQPAKQTDATQTEEKTNQKRDLGTVVYVEDAGYPMFAIDIKSDTTGKTTAFLLNVEDVDMEHNDVYQLKDQKVEIHFTEKKDPFVMDIVHADTAILGNYAPANHNGFSSISGTLSGAEEPSQGDLPGDFSITASENEKMQFEYYIDEQLSLINGQKATVYYEFRAVYSIKKIKKVD